MVLEFYVCKNLCEEVIHRAGKEGWGNFEVYKW